jgi:hypothetical protein
LIKPAPYAADVQAKGWRFELDHERIRRSDTWALAPAEIKPWLLMLWMTAWEQAPCGSLPAADELVAARIGMPMKTFAKHRACLMRGWWQAEDGRLYHDTLVERVVEMIGAKDKERSRKAAYRARMDAERMAASQGSPDLSHGTDKGQTRDSHGSDPGRDDTGTGTGTSSSLRSEDLSSGSAESKYPAEFEEAWQAYPDRPGRSKGDACKAWRARVKAGAAAEAILAGVQRYAAFCVACRTEPQFIKQPATFFGPGEHYLADWAPPALGATPRAMGAPHKHSAAAAAIFDMDEPGVSNA